MDAVFALTMPRNWIFIGRPYLSSFYMSPSIIPLFTAAGVELTLAKRKYPVHELGQSIFIVKK